MTTHSSYSLEMETSTVIKWFSLLTLVLMVTLTAGVAFAQEDEASGDDAAVEASESKVGPMNLGAAVGAGIVMIGAAFGISRIGSAAVEIMSRQP